MAEETKNRSETPNVLVLDDQEAVLLSIKSLFRNYPYSFRLFSSPTIARQALRSTTFDVIISNLHMSRYNGLEFMRDIAGIQPSASRILISGSEDKEIIAAAVDGGVIDHFVFKPWEDEEFIAVMAKAVKGRISSTPKTENDMLNEFESLPSPPRFQLKLNEMLNDADVPITMLVAEIEMNPSLVARLLRIANSVHFGARKRIVNVREAVLFVGTEYIASLVAALEAFGLYSASVREDYMELIEKMEVAATRRALIARDISSRWPGLKNRYVPYIASLLQDIGLLARICLRPELYGEFLRLREEKELSARDAESEVFGRNSHEQIGSAILERWNFPPEMVKAVRLHHSAIGIEDAVKIVQLATVLGGRGDDYPHDSSVETLALKWREKLGLKDDEDSLT